MRIATLAATAAMFLPAVTSAVAAQPGVARPGHAMHAPRGLPPRPAIRGGHPRVSLPGPRWGGRVQGRWYGGHYAPGGWAAYRAPVRGFLLPRYWVAPSFYIQDWSNYGLVAPQAGYGWYRYYDDAVLADRGGRVIEYRSGIDWDARDTGRYVRDDGYYDRFEAERGYDEGYAERRDDGVGGAVIGGVAGAVAGNVIAGRGNRVAGTVLGAGVGALAGTAIDRAEDRGRPVPPPPQLPRGEGFDDRYGAPYPMPGYDPEYDDVPVAPDDGYRGDPPVRFASPNEQVQPLPDTRRGYRVTRSDDHVRHQQGYTTTVQGGGGYIAGGYYYPPQTVTTITVGSPVVTTTTTEEVVTYATPRTRHRKIVRRTGGGSKTLCRC